MGAPTRNTYEFLPDRFEATNVPRRNYVFLMRMRDPREITSEKDLRQFEDSEHSTPWFCLDDLFFRLAHPRADIDHTAVRCHLAAYNTCTKSFMVCCKYRGEVWWAQLEIALLPKARSELYTEEMEEQGWFVPSLVSPEACYHRIVQFDRRFTEGDAAQALAPPAFSLCHERQHRVVLRFSNCGPVRAELLGDDANSRFYFPADLFMFKLWHWDEDAMCIVYSLIEDTSAHNRMSTCTHLVCHKHPCGSVFWAHAEVGIIDAHDSLHDMDREYGWMEVESARLTDDHAAQIMRFNQRFSDLPELQKL